MRAVKQQLKFISMMKQVGRFSHTHVTDTVPHNLAVEELRAVRDRLPGAQCADVLLPVFNLYKE